MHLLSSVVIAFAMFSRLPMPQVEWSPKNMRYTMAAFPLVGVVAGLCATLWGLVVLRAGLPPLVSAVGLALLPVLITGGIHLDGLCDTTDALASHADKARMQEILKDPHAGAFACIGLVCYLLAYTALASLLPASATHLYAAMGGVYVLSRALSGLAVVFFPCARDSGLAHTFADAAARRNSGIVLCLWALAAGAFLFFSARLIGLLAVAAALVVFGLYHRMAMRRFGGISGDLAGWFLQWCELACLAALALPALRA